MLIIFVVFTAVVELGIWLLTAGKIAIHRRNLLDMPRGSEIRGIFEGDLMKLLSERKTLMFYAPVFVAALCSFNVLVSGSF